MNSSVTCKAYSFPYLDAEIRCDVYSLYVCCMLWCIFVQSVEMEGKLWKNNFPGELMCSAWQIELSYDISKKNYIFVFEICSEAESHHVTHQETRVQVRFSVPWHLHYEGTNSLCLVRCVNFHKDIQRVKINWSSCAGVPSRQFAAWRHYYTLAL